MELTEDNEELTGAELVDIIMAKEGRTYQPMISEFSQTMATDTAELVEALVALDQVISEMHPEWQEMMQLMKQGMNDREISEVTGYGRRQINRVRQRIYVNYKSATK